MCAHVCVCIPRCSQRSFVPELPGWLRERSLTDCMRYLCVAVCVWLARRWRVLLVCASCYQSKKLAGSAVFYGIVIWVMYFFVTSSSSQHQ